MTSVLTYAECPKGRLLSLIALFHVRWRPLYCKQLRASLNGLSALAYFPPSLATACHKETSVANNTEVATVFFVSLRVSHKLFSMQASFLSPPPHFLEALFSSPLLFLSVAPTERTETDTPPSQRFVCQYGQLGSGTKAHWRCPHTANPLPKQVHNRLAHSPQTPLSLLSSISPQLRLTKHSLQRSFFVFSIGYIANPGHFKCMFITI